MSTRSIAPASTLRARQPYSRGHFERVRRYLLADEPWAYWHRMTPPKRVQHVTRKTIGFLWRWRDVSPGALLVLVLWLWMHSPVVWGWRPPVIPLWPYLAAVGLVIADWAVRADKARARTANRDRRSTRVRRMWQAACLDLPLEPIPPVLWDDDKGHVLLLCVSYEEGTDEGMTYRRAAGRLTTIFHKPTELLPAGDGTAIVAIRDYDPLDVEPELPAFLGNADGPELDPAYNALPIGIDHDAGYYLLNAWQQHILMAGTTRSGKSTTAVVFGLACIAAPHVRLRTGDPQNLSLACLRAGCEEYAGDPAAILELVRRFVAAMGTREREMAAANTSLATPSERWPLEVLMLDEVNRLLNVTRMGKAYVDEMLGLLGDVLSAGAKNGFVLVCLMTNPRKTVLPEGFRDNFTTTLCFRTRDAYASAVAIGKVPPKYAPHHLPKGQPGRCVVVDDGYEHLRTFRMWDHHAAELAASLRRQEPAPCPWPAPTATPRPPSPSSVIDVDVVELLPVAAAAPAPPAPEKLSAPEKRRRIVEHLQRHSRQTVREISAATGVAERTVRFHLADGPGGAADPIPVRRHGNGTYSLVGES